MEKHEKKNDEKRRKKYTKRAYVKKKTSTIFHMHRESAGIQEKKTTVYTTYTHIWLVQGYSHSSLLEKSYERATR